MSIFGIMYYTYCSTVITCAGYGLCSTNHSETGWEQSKETTAVRTLGQPATAHIPHCTPYTATYCTCTCAAVHIPHCTVSTTAREGEREERQSEGDREGQVEREGEGRGREAGTKTMHL